MAIDFGPELAAGASTAHEVSQLAGGDPHNEGAMDMENNAKGYGLGCQTRLVCETVVKALAATGGLTRLDGEIGKELLLVPSNW